MPSIRILHVGYAGFRVVPEVIGVGSLLIARAPVQDVHLRSSHWATKELWALCVSRVENLTDTSIAAQ